MTRTHERLIQVIAAICITSGLILWLTSTFRENMLFFITPSELASLPENHPIKAGKRFRLGGIVAPDSIKKNGINISFSVEDKKNILIKIHYHGITPELFSENQGIIAEGTFKNGLFEAERLLAKHDEYYRPKDAL